MSTSNNNFPYEIKDLDQEESAEVFNYYDQGFQDGFIRIGPKGYFFTNGLKADIKNIYNMPLRPDDIFVVTFPKTGTTWTQELVWMVANNFDYQKSSTLPLPERFPFLEVSMLINSERGQLMMKKNLNGDEQLTKLLESMTTPGSVIAASLPSPRFLKSHLPLSLLPPSLLDTTKVVYVARDPRDVVVSYYHHTKLFTFMGFTGDFQQFWECFRKNFVDWGPFFPHVIEAWEKRNHPNLLFIFYEDMLKDLRSTVHSVAEFLGKSVTDEQVARVCDHLSFQNFKKNPMLNYDFVRVLGWLDKDRTFMRKGKAGDWHDYFDDEMATQAQQWIDDNLRNTDLRFPSVKQ